MRVPSCWFRRATSAAHNGGTALVPPALVSCPPTITSYPGVALPATSGRARPAPSTPICPCHAGRGKISLTPPPLEPNALLHATSSAIAPPRSSSVVPPQESACGLEPGNETCAPPSPTPADEPRSPLEQQTVIPSSAASAKARSTAFMACRVQRDST